MSDRFDDVKNQRRVYARTGDIMRSYNPKTWNYDLPINLWESLPWFLRWPMGIGLVLFFGGAIVNGFILWWRLS